MFCKSKQIHPLPVNTRTKTYKGSPGMKHNKGYSKPNDNQLYSKPLSQPSNSSNSPQQHSNNTYPNIPKPLDPSSYSYWLTPPDVFMPKSNSKISDLDPSKGFGFVLKTDGSKNPRINRVSAGIVLKYGQFKIESKEKIDSSQAKTIFEGACRFDGDKENQLNGDHEAAAFVCGMMVLEFYLEKIAYKCKGKNLELPKFRILSLQDSGVPIDALNNKTKRLCQSQKQLIQHYFERVFDKYGDYDSLEDAMEDVRWIRRDYNKHADSWSNNAQKDTCPTVILPEHEKIKVSLID